MSKWKGITNRKARNVSCDTAAAAAGASDGPESGGRAQSLAGRRVERATMCMRRARRECYAYSTQRAVIVLSGARAPHPAPPHRPRSALSTMWHITSTRLK
ncbi:hypothetical protein EVAR_35648_1 [Eumeta japonica]|uniref:Uncharacterized protein n=1 Tax=Eumeta variegata TaxID=151549 RepID=A0A4C1WCA1_EUMVA|nr:hypothetical protein EVAR_35648_1 [Eumeta japonica]